LFFIIGIRPFRLIFSQLASGQGRRSIPSEWYCFVQFHDELREEFGLGGCKPPPLFLKTAVVKSFPLSGNLSLIILIAVNLLPIAGVLFWEWNVFEIVSLYWFENIVIGAVNILKMLTATGDTTDLNATKTKGIVREDTGMPDYLRNREGTGVVSHGIKLFLVPFFTFHYGMFCFVHGFFVFGLLGGKDGGRIEGSPLAGMASMVSHTFDSGGIWFIYAIIGSHLFSFFYIYLGKGEFRRISAPALMKGSYGRIVVLHIAILFGAFVITALGSPVFLLILLIVGKIVLDVKLHIHSHRNLSSQSNLAALSGGWRR